MEEYLDYLMAKFKLDIALVFRSSVIYILIIVILFMIIKLLIIYLKSKVKVRRY